MFRQLLAWLHLSFLQASMEEDGTDVVPSKLLQIQRKDLHTLDEGALDIWRVGEKDVIARVAGGVEIKDSVLLLQDTRKLIHPSEKQPHDV